ncbi:hypothetical protein Y032_0020g107 [Ancylostoma ceylanicum]|uniref:Zinc-hook domain-containing protein n=2 Tax=Ancylostoma ceylanicum TaxID=53326 RepID=A0A016V289_9BILA|nr:hypothetical protein Y032_0020g107 [Ancylostoma ceylanicum]
MGVSEISYSVTALGESLSAAGLTASNSFQNCKHTEGVHCKSLCGAMVLLHQLMVRGVRSVGPSEEETQVIRFLDPLTIISGPNGSGKTTLIEALNYVTTGALPAGKLASFVHSLEASNKPRVDGMVKLQFKDCKGRVCVATKRVNATMKKGGKLQCKSDEFNIQITTADGQVNSLSSKVADFQKEVVNLLGVPASILDNVIFCHQEESQWPLSEPKELKQRFDHIFQLTRFVKALDVMKKMKKDYEGELAALIEKQACKEMVVKSKKKYLQQRDSCEQLRKESKEKISALEEKVKECGSVIAKANEELVKLEALERKAEVKRAELHVLKDQLTRIRVSPYPGSESELRAEIREMDSSSEFRELEAQRDRLKMKIDSISKDIMRIKREKDEAECEMRKVMSCEMVRRDLEKEVEVAERELRATYQLIGPDYVGELQKKIELEEQEMKKLKESSASEREKEQTRLDVAQMKCTKLSCEMESASSAMETLNREIKTVERKLQDAAVSSNEIAGLSEKINTLETRMSTMPDIDEKRTERLRTQRQRLQKELEALRQSCSNAEEFEGTEREVQRKSSKKTELEHELEDLLEKHSDAFVSTLGKNTNGPWSASVNSSLKSGEESNKVIENDLKRCERDLDRASQSLKQSSAEEEKLINEVEQLRKKIFDLCGCSSQEVAENLSETRHLLSKARKELSSLSTKAMLYESWSEETKARSCCPLCERKFSSKAGANELSGKLLDMSLSMPDDIERLEKQVAEAEERERKLASAVVYVDQCKKIMEEKVRQVRKQMSESRKEEAALTTKVGELRDAMEKALITHRKLLEIKADVSLMDSLFTSIQTLNSELEELNRSLSRLPHSRSVQDMKKELAEKEVVILPFMSP